MPELIRLVRWQDRRSIYRNQLHLDTIARKIQTEIKKSITFTIAGKNNKTLRNKFNKKCMTCTVKTTKYH